ncbi:DUF5686 family protein [Jiulongibacter sp. NS-SX5]|uniref:DUF5686 family protein n=1 Tax=Jiulongibacter sp. NS-SX5 TaxID=3463854 RepID=UPI004058AF62
MKQLYLYLILFISSFGFSQNQFSGIVKDLETDQPLEYVNITSGNSGTQTDSLGRFLLKSSNPSEFIRISLVGYESRAFLKNTFFQGGVIYLKQSRNELNEVLVTPDENPAWRIIRAARENEKRNNPQKYDEFKADSYTKIRLRVDSLVAVNSDSLNPRFKTGLKSKETQEYLNVLLLENIGDFYFKKGQQKEVVRHTVSNIPKLFPVNLLFSDEQNPLGFYQPFYKINTESSNTTDGNAYERNYINPLNSGSFSIYDFQLTDTLYSIYDSVFVIQFKPYKNTKNALKGELRISSNFYAIQQIEVENADSLQNASIYLKQEYVFEKDKWYPKFRTVRWEYPYQNSSVSMRIRLTNSQYLSHFDDSLTLGEVYFDGSTKYVIDKADTTSFEEFEKLRPIVISDEERIVYKRAKSSLEKIPIIAAGLKLMEKPSKWIMQASLPIGPFLLLLDQNHTNYHELARGGLGLQNNLLANPRFGFRASVGFGLRDRTFKYHTSASWFITKDRYNRLSTYHIKDIRPPGQVNFLGPNYSTPYPQSLFFDRKGYIVDGFKTTGAALYIKPIRWTWFRFFAEQQNVTQLNYSISEENAQNKVYHWGVNFRFARKERFVRNGFFENVVSNYFPILAFNAEQFKPINSSPFYRFSFDLTQQIRWKRIGYDLIRIHGGNIWGEAPYNFLYNNLGGSRGFFGFNKPGFVSGNFLEFASNRYIYADVVHYFGKNLIKSKISWFQPQIAIGHRFSWSELDQTKRLENLTIDSFKQGQYEVDLYINQVVLVPIMGFKVGFGVNFAYNYSSEFNGPRRWVVLPNFILPFL